MGEAAFLAVDAFPHFVRHALADQPTAERAGRIALQAALEQVRVGRVEIRVLPAVRGLAALEQAGHAAIERRPDEARAGAVHVARGLLRGAFDRLRDGDGRLDEERGEGRGDDESRALETARHAKNPPRLRQASLLAETESSIRPRCGTRNLSKMTRGTARSTE